MSQAQSQRSLTAGNEQADQLAGEAAFNKQKGRTSIAWLEERISRTIAQIRTVHWLCGPYLKRIRK
jgi:hypothetical protein